MSESEKQWYRERLKKLKEEYDNTDDRYSKRKIDILQQIKVIEEILK